MPIVDPSTSYHAPFLRGGAHLQTIYPSYFTHVPPVDYQREKMDTPDGDYLYLDWAKCDPPSPRRELLIISHGFCGHTSRHYVLAFVHAFRKRHIDCLAWNYRGCGAVENSRPVLTTYNSTNELGWVVNHAVQAGYRRIYLAGFSMGGSLVLLYLGRDAASVPPEVKAGVSVCGTIDPSICVPLLTRSLFGVYDRHFTHDMVRHLLRMRHLLPASLSLDGIEDVHTMPDFDQRFTAPLMGFKDAADYYRASDATPYLASIRIPALLIHPRNDPMLDGGCYPVDLARDSPVLYLEMPKSGGHCGFITPKGKEWWPAARSAQFLLDIQ